VKRGAEETPTPSASPKRGKQRYPLPQKKSEGHAEADSPAKIFRVPAFQITTSVSSTPKRESGPSIKAPSRRGQHRGRIAPTRGERRPFTELDTLYEGSRGRRRVKACHRHGRAACQKIANRQTFKRGNGDGEGGKPPAKKLKTP